MAPRQRQLCETTAAAVFAALRLRLSSAKLSQCLSDPGGGLFYDVKFVGSVAGLMSEMEAHAGLLNELLLLGVLNKIVLQSAVKELNDHHGGKLMPSGAVSAEWVRFQACGLKLMLMKVRKVSTSASDGSRLPAFLKKLVGAHRKCAFPEDESQGSSSSASSAFAAPLVVKNIEPDVAEAPVWQTYGLSPPHGVQNENEVVMSSAPDSHSPSSPPNSPSPGYSGAPLKGPCEMPDESLEGVRSLSECLGPEPARKAEPPSIQRAPTYVDWGRGRVVRLGLAGAVPADMADGPAGFQVATFADGERVATELPNLNGQRPLPSLTKKQAVKQKAKCLSAKACRQNPQCQL